MNKIEPLVSVIIPTFNRMKTIERAIRSVLSQTYKNHEIIIIDDGSDDQTREILDFYKDRIFYYYQNNSGPAHARNTGLNYAKGKWIAFLDSDDWWLPNKIERQLIAVIDFNSDVCFHDVFMENIDGINHEALLEKYTENETLNWKYTRDPFIKSVIIEDTYKKLMINNLLFLTPAFLIKSNVIKEVGGYRKAFLSSEDYDLYYRLAMKYKFLYLNNKYTVVHNNIKNIQSIERIYRDRIEAIKLSMHEQLKNNNKEYARIAKNGLIYQLRCLAGFYLRNGFIKMAKNTYKNILLLYTASNDHILEYIDNDVLYSININIKK